MAKNNLSELRAHLFDVLERLKEGNDPDADTKDTIDIDRARAINETAQTIIESAKVEVSALKIIAKEGDIDTYLKDNDLLRLNGKSE